MAKTIIELSEAMTARRAAIHQALLRRGEIPLSQIARESGVNVFSIQQFRTSGAGLAVDKLARLETTLERLGLLSGKR